MIYTVTLNPSIDYTMRPERLCAGEINRSRYETYTYGGKGINVSAMLHNLGVNTTVLGFAGGFVGGEIERLLGRAGVVCDFCPIKDTSRINVKIVSDEESAINGKGPFIRLEEERELLKKLSELTCEDTVVIAGTSPDSESGRLLENVIAAAAHTRLVADMEGEALAAAIKRKPFLIKPNYDEVCAVFGKAEMSDSELCEGAKKLRAEGVLNVLISLGERGALLASDDGNIYRIRAPRTDVKSTVGAGDSLLAGFLAGYDSGAQFALALGTAAGSATAASDTIAEYEDVMNVFSHM